MSYVGATKIFGGGSSPLPIVSQLDMRARSSALAYCVGGNDGISGDDAGRRHSTVVTTSGALLEYHTRTRTSHPVRPFGRFLGGNTRTYEWRTEGFSCIRDDPMMAMMAHRSHNMQ